MKIMSVNAGSSSLKFKLYEMPEEKVITSGIAERIGHEDGIFRIKKLDGTERKEVLPILDHATAVDLLLKALIDEKIISSLEEIKGIGHRVVQGGKYFSCSAEFNQYTEDRVKELIPLAPLHNGAHLIAFHAFKNALPNVGNVAVFDTAFHQTMEPEDYLYPIPYEYYEKYAVRRYGAHGTSHKYLSITAKEKYLKDKEHYNIITLHLGSGASLAAIKDGKCIATTMGLTPLGGVMMGTRTGDMDPSVMEFLCTQTGKSVQEIYNEFNFKSGLLGISGISNDTRDIEEGYYKGEERCVLAVKMWARRIADFIGSYYIRLGHVDLLVFSAGIGENAPLYRKAVIDNITEALKVKIDDEANKNTVKGKEGIISTKDSAIPVAVIPTDEEVMIARDVISTLHLL